MPILPERFTDVRGVFYQRRIKLLFTISALLTLYLLGAYSGILKGDSLSYWSDFFWTFAALATGWRCLVTAKNCPVKKEQRAWTMFGLAALSWFVGMLIWDYHEIFVGDIVPFPSIGDWFYMGYALFFAAGLFNYLSQKPSREHRIIRVANFFLIICTVMVLCYILLAQPIQQSEHSFKYTLYALLHSQLTVFIFVFGVYCYLFFVWRDNRNSFQLLLSALFVMAVTDTLYALQLLGHSYDATSYLNIYWLLSFALQYWSAFEQDSVTQQSPLEYRNKLSVSSEKLEATMPAIALASVSLLCLYYRNTINENIIIVIAVAGVVFAFFLSLREWHTNNLESNLINEQRHTNKQLVDAQHQINHILSVSPAIIYACRAYGDFGSTFVSENIKSLGYSVDDCLSNTAFWRESIHPDERDHILEGIDCLFKEGYLTHEYRFRKKDGNYIWVLDHVHLVRDSEGVPVEMVGSWLDITEHKKAEEALLKIDILKSEFVATAAHELRTPLTAIMGFTELLSDQTLISNSSEEQKKEFLYHINDNCERLNKMVNSLLDVSRIESGQKFPIDKKTQSIKALLENVIKRFNLRVNHQITLDIKRGTPETLEFDTHRLDQVIENLLVNSIKYSPKESAITIITESIDGQCKFTVIDRGIGMSDEQKSQVFDKFYRADASNTAIEGVGLGMCIVKQTIEDHGGKIWIDSVLGEGTKVYFTLPV